MQPALGVHPAALGDVGGGQHEEHRVRERLDVRHAERLAVEEEGAQEGLEAVGQHAAARAARLAHLVVVVAHRVVHAARGSHVADGRVVDERATQRRELPFLVLGERVEDKVGRGELQHGVAEPLEPLVVRRRAGGAGGRRHEALLLHEARRVREGLHQQAKVLEAQPRRRFEGEQRLLLLVVGPALERLGALVLGVGRAHPHAAERQ
eukprot:4196076-Prymnesium_polylepis.1